MDRKRILAFSSGLVAITVLVYYRVCGYEFISLHDKLDSSYIFGGLSETNFRWLFHSHSGLWIPLTWLSYMAESEVFGDNAGGYHLTNLILHVINVLLVFSVFTKATGNANRSAFVAALFAVHPLHIESVAWITERKDVLSIFFGLLALNAYVSYAQRRRIALYVLSLVLFTCSLLAKQTLVTFPFILCLMDYWPLGRLAFGSLAGRGNFAVPPIAETRNSKLPNVSVSQTTQSAKLLALEKVPFLLLSAAFCGVVLIAQ